MRSKYPGVCYVCGELVAAGEGYFERWHGGWRVQCRRHLAEKRELSRALHHHDTKPLRRR